MTRILSSSVPKQYIINALLLCCFKVLVDISYLSIQERFAYAGLFKLVKSDVSIWLSWGLFFLLLPLALKSFTQAKISARISSILFIVSVVPFTSLVGVRADYDVVYIALMTMYWLIFFIGWHRMPSLTSQFTENLRSDAMVYFLAFFLSAVVIYVWARYAQFHIQTDFAETIYETRARARGFSISKFTSYLWLSADNILPVCVVYFLLKRKYYLAFILSGVVFINFSITATKQIFALLVIGLLGYRFGGAISNGSKVLGWAVLFFLMCIFEPYIFGTYILSYVPYRVMFIPAELHFSYFSFFQGNPVDYFMQGPLKILFESAYQEPIAFLIGEFSIGDFGARANNGLFSDAYQNLGAFGVLLTPLLIVVFLKILDGACRGLDGRLFVVVYAYVSFVLVGIPLSTALFSSGLLLLLCILFIFPRQGLKLR